ncbi:SAV_915 family protein [Kitasatospora sp. NPDC057692]|uniref:SAV_915 family protein n=1 Tax=Kitasatospora sp. NPDC057692 TaxID=3346215 RepID=UPI0036C735F4
MTAFEEHPVRYGPVRTVGDAQVLRLFRQRDGTRCAVEFSSAAAPHAPLGPEQEAAELTERALREMTAPLGIERLLPEPKLVAAPTTARCSVPAAQNA